MLLPGDEAGVFVGYWKAVNRVWKLESTYTAELRPAFSKHCEACGRHTAPCAVRRAGPNSISARAAKAICHSIVMAASTVPSLCRAR